MMLLQAIDVRGGRLHPKGVLVKRNLAFLFAVLLLAGVSVAWAGEDSAAAKSDNDDAVITQPAKPSSPSKPSSPAKTAPKPSSDDRQSDRRDDSRVEETPARSQGVRQQESPASQPPEVREQGRSEIRSESGSSGVPDPRRGNRSSEPDMPAVLGRGGRRGGGSHHRGSYGPPPASWGSGRYWGRRDRWRYDRWHYYGNWRFIWHWGPIVYVRPVVVDPVLRIPRSRVGVYIRQTGDDWVGEDFARELRGQLSDAGLRPVYSEDDAKLELYVVSMDQDPEDPGYGSSISISYVWLPGDRFITAQMLDVGRREIEPLASEVVGYVDELVDKYR
jgi:hypothetical protein